MRKHAGLALVLYTSAMWAVGPECGDFGKLSPHAAKYEEQDRGDAAAYAAYYAGMDATERQKVALSTAFLPTRGTIADMGSGSGSSSASLGRLYPKMKVIAVDNNPKAVAYAREKYPLANVEFREGDVADPLFPPQTLDGTANISTNHHVTTFNGYSLIPLYRMLDNQLAAMNYDRPYFTRDFVVPVGPEKVFMDLPNHDGKAEGDVTGLSTAALFETRFARDFVSSVHRKGGVPFRKLPSPRPGFSRFELDLRTAHEFVLHKDYRKSEDNWRLELQEEYTYFSQRQFEAELEKRGLRVLVSKPIYNPWIIDNRIRNKVFFSNLEGEALPLTPTNYFIVGEKVHAGRPILLKETSNTIVEPQYLKLRHFKDGRTGQIFDLVSRPEEVVDLVPWFEHEGDLYVLNRHQYPRPILGAAGVRPLNEAYGSGFINEPHSIAIPPGQSAEATIQQHMKEQLGPLGAQPVTLGPSVTYLPSPGGIAERVKGQLVQVPAHFDPVPLPANFSGFSESGYLQPVQAQQALRSYHVGGMFEARLELNVYELLLNRGRPVGPWIGANVNLKEQPGKPVATSTSATLNPPSRAPFTETNERANFLEVRTGKFTEVLANGGEGKSQSREYVVPKSHSTNSVASLPVFKRNGKVYVGLETRDLPAAQLFNGSSALVTTPAWRLPKTVDNIDRARDFVVDGLAKEFDVKATQIIPLGGEYMVSPGLTPEQVMPFAVEVDASKALSSKLSWVPLDELVQQRDKITDAHLKVTMLRLAHATGLIE